MSGHVSFKNDAPCGPCAPPATSGSPGHARRQQLKATVGSRGVLCGLKNLGATCYMNALLQTMFMTPELRRHILTQDFDEKQRHPRNVAYQLQLVFAQLLHQRRAFVDPRPLVDSFGMGDGAHRQQHDVQELNRVLIDVLQAFVDRTDGPQVLRALYEGAFDDAKVCTTCQARTATPSPFHDVSVVIAGHRSLEECLDHFVRPDEIEGVHCDACDASRTVLKGLDFARFPQMLTVQLRRIDYNFETDKREKLTDDIRLPLTLATNRWLREGGDEFDLVAVIAHRGTAYHGHYYCYVRVADAPAFDGDARAAEADVGGRWLKFDDDVVTAVSPDEVEEYVDPAAWRTRGETGGSGDGGLGVDEAPAAGVADDDAFPGDIFDAPMPDTAARHISGHSYYAVYRRRDLPPLSVAHPDVALPTAVVDACAASGAGLDAAAAELETLAALVPVAVTHDGARHWLEATEETTMGALTVMAREKFLPPESAATTALRLRAYSVAQEVLGATFDGAATLGSLGYDAETTVFLQVAPETAPEEVAARWREHTQWDLRFPLAVHDPLPGIPGGFEPKGAVCVAPDDSVEDLLMAIAAATGIALPDVRATFIADKELFSLRHSASGDLRDLTTLVSAVAGLPLADKLLVESAAAPPPPAQEESPFSTFGAWAAGLHAAVHCERLRQITVAYRYKPSPEPTVRPTTTAAPNNSEDPQTPGERIISQANLSARYHERTRLVDVKARLCAEFGLADPAEVQLLLDSATRECDLRQPLSSVSCMRRVDLVLFGEAAIGEDEAHVDVSIMTGDYVKPLVHGGRVCVKRNVPLAELRAIVAAREPPFAGLPRDPELIRLRGMKPMTTKVGNPLLAATLDDYLVQERRAGQFKLVCQPVAAPETLTANSLLLRLHRWDSSAPDPVSGQAPPGLGPVTELVFGKDGTMASLLEAAAAATDIPLERLQCGAAYYYLLPKQASVASAVKWPDFPPYADADTKRIGPLRLEHDAIILCRDSDEPWPQGIEPCTDATAAAKGGKPKGPKGNKPGSKAEKQSSEEHGIRIAAVWDYDPSLEQTAPADDSPAPDAAAQALTANDEAVALSLAMEDGCAPSRGVADAGRYPPQAYDPLLHGELATDCRICYDTVEGGDQVVILPCHHLFHHECLAPWLKDNARCPQCNASLA